MNTLCLVLVLFTTQIIYTKEESSVDQNKTAFTTSGRYPPPLNQQHGIDFDKVELFKDDDEPPANPQDFTSGSDPSEPPIKSTDLPGNGTTPNTRGNQTSGKIYEDYDINDLELNKYKIMVSPNKFKTINATNLRVINRNPGPVYSSRGSQIGIDQFGIKFSSQYLVLPNGTRFPGYKAGRNVNNPAFVPGPSTPGTNPKNSVTPIPWVISPACLHKNDSKYLFSAIFNKKPTVHLLTADNGTAPDNQSPNIVINNNSVTLSVSNATQPKDGDVMMNFSNTNKTVHNQQQDNKSAPDYHEIPKIEDTLLKGLKEFTKTIQNPTKPQNHIVLPKIGDSITISGGLPTPENEPNPIQLLEQTVHNMITPNITAQQIQQQTAQLIPKRQAGVSVKTPTMTTPNQGNKKIEQLPLLLLENSLLQTPLPGKTLSKTQTTLLPQPPLAIHNILNSELGERSFFPPELKENFKRTTGKKAVGDLITQKETDVQSSDVLYELFKNISLTNVINEDLNRKLLDESQIHTQQNWQLIKGNTDILNTLKNNNESSKTETTTT